MSTLPAGWRLQVHEQLTSTADRLREAAEAGEAEGLAILALRQSAGRGTQGRAWASPAGNLFLSVLLRPGGPAREVPQWALLAAVALFDAMRPHAGVGLTLKWPNDLLLNGAKCAGILSEAGIDPPGQLGWLAFGMGVNLAEAPAVPCRATAALPPPALEPRHAAAAILASLDRWRLVWAREGFGPVREAWLARGHAPGERLTVRSAGGLVEGCFEGLDERGALRLRTARGMETLLAGEVNP